MPDLVCEWRYEDGERCERPAVVGVGQNATWVCMEHYEAYLKLSRDVVERALKEVSG